jgi:signal recognition particle receptor subunit beta
VYANKQDIDGALSADEIMKSLELEEITERPWSITSCSALNGEGVKEGLEWLVDKAVKKSD